MLRTLLLSTVVLLGQVARPQAAEEPPPAPDGFTWKRIDAVKAAFLMPDGWFFKEEKQKGVHAFFISKESIQKGGEFATGLTVNVFKLDKDGPQRAMKTIAQYAQLGEVLDLFEAEQGVLKLYGARIHVTADPPPFTEHLLAIGNSRTNTLYLILFESPDSTWDDAWKTGEVILNQFLLDDEI